MRLLTFLPLLGALSFSPALGLAPTDEYRDADIQQSGYLPNHNMDPSVVNSAAFGQLWKVSFNPLEQFYAKPLTYTPLAGGPQLLFLASTMNYIRTLDAKTGALINSRQVHTPFLQSDIGCADIPNYIGIVGTPTIDPATDIVYFFSKTYIPNFRVPGNTGTSNGVYYFHAVNINTLADVYPPVLIDGTVADNAPQKYFVGGIILQRPSLAQIGNIVYGAFGGHCDLFNYTGVVIGVDIVKAKVVTQFAMESGPLAPQSNILTQNGGGGEGGIWMSGMGLTSDGQRLFAVVGNGGAHQNQGAPAAGTSSLQTLGETALNLAVDGTTGSLSLSDYFQPYDYINMDAADQDFGSGGLVLLDPATFSGGGVNKIAVTAGKNGKIYVLNANNLGGYKLGTGQTDGIVQTIVTNSAVFGAAGSYPGEGGYIYFTPVGKATQAYSLGFGASNIPQFSFAGASLDVSAGRVGTGVPTVTSLNGQAGTAILWMTDPDAGLRAWYAVPQNNVLVKIPLPQIGGANKFQRPAFGDGRLYVTDANGVVYCLGSPVNLPLNCTSPIDFGKVALGAKATKNVTCKANIAITSIVGVQVGSGYFTASNSSLPNGPLAAGASFTFPVTWDLTNVSISNSQNASFGSVSPGVKSAPLTFITINGAPGYATTFPISLTGTQVSTTPFLTVTPSTVDFGPVIILDPINVPTIPGIFTIANKGLSPLTILGYAYTTDELASSPVFTNSTFSNGVWDLGYGFTAATLPAIGSTIAPGSAISVPAVFNPINGTQTYASYWQVWSNGGSVNIILEGSAALPPVANFSIGDGSGGWLPQTNLLMDFGNVAPGSSSSRQIRICNQGGSALEVDKSKPPYGVFHISDPAELHESQLIPPGQCAYGNVLFVPNTEEYNLPNLVLTNSWTLNVNDLNWGVHVVQITGTVVSTKVGPKNSTGATVYNYLGCFAESTNGPRLFQNEPLSPSPSMSNANCQNACYGAANYAFAGTEFGDECWCGNTPPPLASQDLTDTLCNMACPGDPNDRCGATGYLSVFYDPTKYIAGTDPALYGPQTIQRAGNFAYQGCYSEGTSGRALAALSPNAPTGGFTIELCAAACSGYSYFGMEYSNQCYCGNTLGTGSVNQTSSVPSVSGCSMTCAGNVLEYCGGPNRLNLYMQTTSATSSTSLSASSKSAPSSTLSNSVLSSSSTSSSTPTPTPTGPSAVTSIPGGTYLGCYSEATASRALTGLMNPIPGASVSVESCQAACSKGGFTYFGVEYSTECYCGNVINAGSVPSTGCSMTCAAAPFEFCGGPSRLNMYQLYPPATTSSTKSTSSILTTSSSSVFISTSSSSTIASSSSSGISSSSSSSTSVLSSSTVQTSSSTVQTSSSTVQTLSSTVQTSSSTSSSAPIPTGPITVTSLAGYNYLGCYSEGNGVRALSGLLNPLAAGYVSVEACASACSQYKYFGVEYAGECYCGNVINTGSVNQSSTDPNVNGCNMICNANRFEYCGGGNRLNMYMVLPLVSSSSSSTVSSSSVISTSQSSSLILSSSSTLPSSTLSSSTSSSIVVLSSSSSVVSSSSQPGTTTSTPTSSSIIPSTVPSSASLSSSIQPSSSLSSMLSLQSPSSSTRTSSSVQPSTSSVQTTSSLATSSLATSSLATSSSSTLSTIRTSSTSTSTSSSPRWTGTPIAGSSIGSWQYLGCASEISGGRALADASYVDSVNMTVESCQAFCTSNNFALAGIEYASQCYCSNALKSPSTTGQTGCTMSCTGLSTEICGGPSRLSLFNNTAYIYPSSPNKVGSYALTGCYKEATAGRLLSGPTYTNSTGMTVESCVAFCASQGANGLVAGVEYAQECYCAASLPGTAVVQPLSSCNNLCKGNNKEFCGAAGMLDVYTYVAGRKNKRSRDYRG